MCMLNESKKEKYLLFGITVAIVLLLGIIMYPSARSYINEQNELHEQGLHEADSWIHQLADSWIHQLIHLITDESRNNLPKLEINNTEYDFGTISQSEGIVSRDLLITNKDNKDITIDELSTSCMCTSAQIIKDGKEGMKYGMDMGGKNPTEPIVLTPNGTATLRIFYDPNMHKDLKGHVTRVVSIFSSAGTQTVKIKLNQVQ